MKKYILSILSVGLLASVTLQSCTDLEEKSFDTILADDFLKTDEQIAAVVGKSYGGLRGITWDWFNPQEASSDELIVPTRGGDWFDNGDWLAYSRHSWNALHGPINGMWGFIFNNISSINETIPIVESNVKAVSELRALRAIYYYMAISSFGNVPITLKRGDNLETKPRAEVYAFIEKELTESIPNLPTDIVYSKMNQNVANMLLAKLYLNAGVFKGSPEWQKALDTINKVIASGKYTLESNQLANFSVANSTSKENIFAIPFDGKLGANGMNFQMRTLHYANQLTYGLGNSPWNGFCTLADFYNSFEDTDLRKKMWLVGQQYSASGAKLKDAKENDLAFVVDWEKDQMTDADAVYQVAGARSQKYEIQKDNPRGEQDNDYVFFRLADALLMKAEALLWLGKEADALVEVNKVRNRAGVADMTKLTAADILAERGRELAWEGWRREDMIRFGTFTNERKFMKNTEKHKTLFPIPQPRLDANPKLRQNPGY
jgi:starch-binding outer membrane protein, SusD/RagB family